MRRDSKDAGMRHAAYPDPDRPGLLTDGQPLPTPQSLDSVPEWHTCDVCTRRLQFYEGYISHLDGHRPGALARKVEPGLFGTARPLPSLAELAGGIHLVNEDDLL